MNYAWTCFIHDTSTAAGLQPLRLWSGEGDLVFEGQTWKGMQRGDASLMALGAVEYKEGQPDRRVTVSIALTDAMLEQALSEDIGPYGVEVGFLYSTDDGLTWNRTPEGTLYGRASNGRISTDNVYTIDVESFLGDLDRSEPVYWSREAYVAQYGADAKGFEQTAELASRGATVSWPPFQ